MNKLNIMKINVIQFLSVLLVITIISSCSTNKDDNAWKKKDLKKFIKTEIPIETLEEVGFESIDREWIHLLFKDSYIYVLNQNDRQIVKFKGEKPLKSYKSPEGMGPGDFLFPRYSFFKDDHTLAILDRGKTSVLFFDEDLNYLGEKKLMKLYVIMSQTGGIIAGGQITKDKVFTTFDRDFNEVEKFVDINTKLPFQQFHIGLLNKVYFLHGGYGVHTLSWYYEKACSLDIYNLATKKKILTLDWELPNNPTEKNYRENKDFSCSEYVGFHGSFYVVMNGFYKRSLQEPKPELLVFDQQGNMILRRDFPFRFLSFDKEVNDTLLYFLDEHDNIASIDLMDILKK